MRLICSLLLWSLTMLLSAQDKDLSHLKANYLEAEGQVQLEAFDQYVEALTKKDRFAADSLISDYLKSNGRQKKRLDWSRLYYRMADVKYRLRDYEQAQIYLDSALESFQNTEPKSFVGITKAYDLKAIIFQRYKIYDSSEFFLSKALRYAEKSDSREVLAMVHNTFGTNHWYQADYAAALKAYNQSLEIRKTLTDSSRVADLYRNIGLTYKVIGDYPTAISYYEKALPIYEETSQSGLANLLNSIGVLYKELSDYDQALLFHKQSMQIRKELEDSVGWSYSLDNIGSAHIEKGDFGQALEVLLLSERLKAEVNGDVRMYNTLSNIGVCYDKLEQHREAISYFERSLAAAEKVDEKRAMARVYNNLNLLYHDEGRYKTALDYGLKSLALSEEINTPGALSISHAYLSKTYKSMGRFSDALDHHERYVTFEKQLFDETAASEKSRLLANYNFDNQQRALEQREAELDDLNKVGDLLRARQLILLVVVVALLLIISLLVFAFRARLKKSRLEKDLIRQNSQLMELSRQNLDQQLQLKDIKLMSYAEQLSQKNELIATFQNRLSADHDKDLFNIANSVEGRPGSGTSWEEFRLKFDQVHGDFIPSLNALHKDLTNNELNISILLRLNLSNKDMASILGTTYDSVKKSVQRLYKKVGCGNADDLRGYLLKI